MSHKLVKPSLIKQGTLILTSPQVHATYLEDALSYPSEETMDLKSLRLCLKPLTHEYLDACFAIMSSPEAMLWS